MKKNNENKPRRFETSRSPKSTGFNKQKDAGERPSARRKDAKTTENKPFKKFSKENSVEKPRRKFSKETDNADANPRVKRNTSYKPRSSEDKPAFAYKKKYSEQPSTRNKARFDPDQAPKKRFKGPSAEENAFKRRSTSQPKEENTNKRRFNREPEEVPAKKSFKPRPLEDAPGGRKKFNSEDKPRTFKPFKKQDSESFEKHRGRDKKLQDTKSAKPSTRRASTEERPQKRTNRDGYYTDKKKADTDRRIQTPTYNLKKYEEKKELKSDTVSHSTRLNRYIANAGICSRRDADILIESGEIKVNGKVVTEMGYQVGTNDIVKYGNRVLNKEKLVYILMNKPKDFITTTEDPDERKTVMDLVKNACEQRVYPVGRLDRNTTGLLLLTNDGELAEKLAHPSNNIKKVYQVELNKPITPEDFQKILDGVELEDGKVTIDDLAIVTPDHATLGLEIHLGRNRIVRRLFEHLGYEVIKLDRVIYAGLTKKDLPRGNWRFLNEKEVITLKYLI